MKMAGQQAKLLTIIPHWIVSKLCTMRTRILFPPLTLMGLKFSWSEIHIVKAVLLLYGYVLFSLSKLHFFLCSVDFIVRKKALL